MDTIAIIIVTAFINILITGIVSNYIFYRYQKKIESSFAISLFEHQTKFVRSHKKVVEALEGLHEKYMIFLEDMKQKLSKVKWIDLSSNKLKKDDFGDTLLKLKKFQEYFESNRLVLSNIVVADIERIYNYSLGITTTVGVASLLEESNDFITVNQLIEHFGLNISIVDLNRPDLRRLFDEAEKEIVNQVLELVHCKLRNCEFLVVGMNSSVM